MKNLKQFNSISLTIIEIHSGAEEKNIKKPVLLISQPFIYCYFYLYFYLLFPFLAMLNEEPKVIFYT
jgi:hypothetical protein